MRKLVSFLVFCSAIIILTLNSIDPAGSKENAFEAKNEAKVIIEPLKLEEDTKEECTEWSTYETYILAKLAMAEAESESIETKAMVIQVILNRVNDEEFPSNIADVIYDEGQFTPVSNGRFDRVEPNQECYDAIRMIEDLEVNIDKEILYFETVTEEKTWHSENLEFLFQSGNLSFYREGREK